ncbi:tRNA epoxyqueuosine(34) reductase QueG [Iodidimonas sp. SYSU 1G8]|uniref:tRNA epoxyqueuosine(34) reductase QueG n=1 Tax=Iodidimonas sp. SYSU 1G8 TaxID=3133967 RepID=UPI0031FE5D0D
MEEGFDAVAFTLPASIPEFPARLRSFLDQGRHGDMGWLAEKADRRGDPRTLWPEVRSIIVTAINYGPQDDPMARLAHTDRGVISVYARNRDYHDVIKKRLKRVGRWLHQSHGAAIKVFVDTAPVPEKPLAQAAGLGWQGKHTNLVSRGFGSWLFLGAIYTDADLPADAPETDHCGQCRNCLDACPTQAFPAPYQLDARRCLSYLTIEFGGHIPLEFRAPMANRIYGCDDCLAVCPWNKFARDAAETAFHPRAELTSPRLTDLAALDDAGFRAFFSGSPIKRIGRDRFVRNVLIALGNSRDGKAVGIVESLLDDTSPLVRAMAAWALRELAPARFSAARTGRLALETDPAVQAEWSPSPRPAAAPAPR